MKIFFTGSAGLIGSTLTLRLLERGDTVIGIDNYNTRYNLTLKESRHARFANHPNARTCVLIWPIKPRLKTPLKPTSLSVS